MIHVVMLECSFAWLGAAWCRVVEFGAAKPPRSFLSRPFLRLSERDSAARRVEGQEAGDGGGPAPWLANRTTVDVFVVWGLEAPATAELGAVSRGGVFFQGVRHLRRASLRSTWL